MKKIMIFAPHPDDDILGCGGSIAKNSRQGHEITTVYMTSGGAGSLTYSRDDLAAIREHEAHQASLSLGVKETIFLKNPDGYLEYNRNNLVRIINLIRDQKPDIIYLPHEQDGNEDHKMTNKLVTNACIRSCGPWFQECSGTPWEVKTILAYEVWTPLQQFSYVEEITSCMEQKIKALRLHSSQLQDIQYGEAIRGLNRYRGIMSGKGQYCECFQVLKIEL